MSINKFRPHVLVVPEDRANTELANGFQNHPAVNFRTIDIKRDAGGWRRVLEVFERDLVYYLRSHSMGHVVLLIDFDGKWDARFTECTERIPEDLRPRVFLIGSGETPEALTRELNLTREEIGDVLAEDCSQDNLERWQHPHLSHNLPEVQRMMPVIKQIIFQGA